MIIFVIIISFTPKYFSQNYSFEQISLKEGLKQSQVNKIYSDSRGFLWLATAGGGLSIFDGVSFINYTENEGLIGNIITDIAEDKSGSIYCSSTWGGISKIEGLNVKTIASIEELSPVFSIENDSYGTVWVAGNQLGYLENDVLKYIETDLKPPYVSGIYLSVKGDFLFVCYNNKLLKIDVLKKTVVFSKSFDVVVTCCLEDDFGNLFIGTQKNGIFKCSKTGEIIQKLTFPIWENNELKEPAVRDIRAESSQVIWAATEYGVVKIEKNNTTVYNSKNGLIANDIQSICFDNQSNIWLGTFGSGVIKITKSPFNYFNGFDPLTKSDNFPIYEDPNGVVWVGNNSEGLFKFDGKSVSIFNEKNGLNAGKIRAFEYFNNTLYIGSNKGLFSISSNGVLTQIKSVGNIYIKSLIKDKNNNLYIGSIGDGVWLMENSGIVTKLDEIPALDAHSIDFDNSGNLVVGTNMGLYKKINGSYTLITEGLNNTFLGSMTRDKNGILWVGTDKSIARLDETIFKSYTEADGLHSALVYFIYSDKNGFLWVGTNYGLDKITLDNNSEIVKIQHYGYTDGFIGIECNSKGVFENEKGDLYFTTVGGLIKYSPWLDTKPIVNLPVYITEIKLFLKPMNLSSLNSISNSNWFNVPDKLVLNHDENHLTFGFVALNYKKSNETKYTYKLEGFDSDWSPPSSTRYAVYSNIQPGNYIFKVKEYGNDFSTIAQVIVRINKPEPPFYRTAWFMLLILVLLLGLLYYFTEYRSAALKKHQNHLKELVESRTAEIKKQDEDKTVMLQEIHHRVKNNLQIIISLFRLQKHFTTNEEAIELFKKSENRINAMAKIHEKLYQTTDLSRISIEDYLLELVNEIIASYDTKNKIELEFSVSKCNINIDQLTPLALIINEIITNSVKYAFDTVEKPVISLFMHQSIIGKITLTISDNGKGFDIEKHWNNSTTMGFELIKSLTEQINGEITVNVTEKGPVFQLTFKPDSK
jgi:two-component sensor histidine kinase/ligand-binding sensor domain-containing protein